MMGYRSPTAVRRLNTLKTITLLLLTSIAAWLAATRPNPPITAQPIQPQPTIAIIAQQPTITTTATDTPTTQPTTSPSPTPPSATTTPRPTTTTPRPTTTTAPAILATPTKTAITTTKTLTPTAQLTTTTTPSSTLTFNLATLDPLPNNLTIGQPITLTGQSGAAFFIDVLLNDDTPKRATIRNGRWQLPLTLTNPGRTIPILQMLTADGEIMANITPDPFIVNQATPTQPQNAPLIITYPAPFSQLYAFDIDLFGTAAPRAIIEILNNGQPIGTIVANNRGEWSYALLQASQGEHRLSARLQNRPQSETTAVPVTLNRPIINPDCENPEPGQDLGETYIIGQCEWLTKIARNLNVDYFELINLNPELSNPNLIRPGMVLRLPPR